jgi:hypothetical protein
VEISDDTGSTSNFLFRAEFNALSTSASGNVESVEAPYVSINSVLQVCATLYLFLCLPRKKGKKEETCKTGPLNK